MKKSKNKAKKKKKYDVEAHAAQVRLGTIRHKSKMENPCKTAWEIFDKCKTGRRKDAMDMALRAGVAYYTARTQYQLWRETKERDRLNALKPLPFMKPGQVLTGLDGVR